MSSRYFVGMTLSPSAYCLNTGHSWTRASSGIAATNPGTRPVLPSMSANVSSWLTAVVVAIGASLVNPGERLAG
jgi:hypothetical protein